MCIERKSVCVYVERNRNRETVCREKESMCIGKRDNVSVCREREMDRENVGR